MLDDNGHEIKSEGDMDVAGALFGIRIVPREPGVPMAELYLEDDENFFLQAAFDVRWLDDLKAVVLRAARQHGRPDDAPFAANATPEEEHLAESIGGKVISIFTGKCPNVKMSYDDWMTLATFIECGVKEALGVTSDPDPDDSPEPVTVQ